MTRKHFPLLLIFLVAWTSSRPAIAESAGSGDLELDPDLDPPRPPIGLQGIELEELETDLELKVDRFILPPYYRETRGPTRLQLVFPLFYFRERTGKHPRTDLGVLPFYWRYREGGARADVYFPFYWRFRSGEGSTDIVLQTYYNRSGHGYNTGFAPLFFAGKDTRDESSYQVVLPPLFWRLTEGDSHFMWAGLYYDKTDGSDFDLGLPPLFFAGRERDKSYLVVAPPLFWRFTDDIAYETKNVLPPFFYNTREHGWSFAFLPLLYIARDRDWDKTLLLPFWYSSRWQKKERDGEVLGEGHSYYLPFLLSYYRYAPGLRQGGAAIFYHFYENEGEYMRMFSPLLWLWGNERSSDSSVFVPPLFFRHDSPVADDTMVGLVYWNFHEHYRQRTFALMPFFGFSKSLYERRWRSWVVPTFDFGVSSEGHHYRLHPIFYRGKYKRSDHLVVAPILWKFTDEEDDDLVVFPFWWSFNDLVHDDSAHVFFPLWWQFDDRRKREYNRVGFPLYWDFHDQRDGERRTVVPPLFWRDRDRRSTMTGFLNFIWHRGQIKGYPFWTFQIFPLLGFGHPASPEGAYWSVLGGLAGWRRQGRTRELKLLWIPFDVSKD